MLGSCLHPARSQGNSSSPHFMRDNKRTLWVTTEKFFSALKPNVFTRGRGKNARVKLMKTSQNTALLWLIPPSWQVPKPRRRLRVWLSAPTELDFCVSSWELQARATHFLSILLKMIRPVLFITRSWKMTCKKGGKALCSQPGCLLNKCPPSSWTHHVGARPWGPYPSS